jgi:hypothetical protein
MATKTRIEQETTVTATQGKKGQEAAADGWWSRLPDHQRAGYAGLLVTLFCALGVAGLFERTNPSSALAPIGIALYNLCGWSAYPLVLSLLAVGILRIAEGLARRPLAPRWLPVEIVTLLLILVAISRLLGGDNVGGLLGQLLAFVLSPLSPGLALVLLLLAALLLFLAILGVTMASTAGMARRLAAGAYRDMGGQRTRGSLPRFDPQAHGHARFPERPAPTRPDRSSAPKETTKTAVKVEVDEDE